MSCEPLTFTFPVVLDQARSGDERAQEQLMGRYYPAVERMVHQQLNREVRLRKPWLTSRFSTGDVVQEVFRSLLGELGAFRGRSETEFIGYLSQVVKNRVLDAVRFHEASRRDGRLNSLLSRELEVGSAEPGPATRAATSEEYQAYEEALRSFPDRERRLLAERLEREVQFKDLAEMLGFSSGAAARRAFYAAQAQLLIRLRIDRDA